MGPKGRRMRAWVTAASFLLFPACMAPIKSEDAVNLIKGLASDQASGCFILGAWVGMGALIPAPAVPGGGGRGYVMFARTNQPGSKVVLNIDGCTFEQGAVQVPIQVVPVPPKP